ncbi:MAG: hypothetical protein ACD_4C00305G0001 [uncultured bacterium (gcode 4)]|uniref:Uncharacterized protein n=1 Tax=uncultured bacterium (gcode 4) TaxID=1234023 RepID=K2F5N2_9BACT|nr:MAG: hypothetical protein ACD_4C00305G0001 [uncultured bacterium (gcode 4)]
MLKMLGSKSEEIFSNIWSSILISGRIAKLIGLIFNNGYSLNHFISFVQTCSFLQSSWSFEKTGFLGIKFHMDLSSFHICHNDIPYKFFCFTDKYWFQVDMASKNHTSW